jgi:hypothetical protein
MTWEDLYAKYAFVVVKMFWIFLGLIVVAGIVMYLARRWKHG